MIFSIFVVKRGKKDGKLSKVTSKTVIFNSKKANFNSKIGKFILKRGIVTIKREPFVNITLTNGFVLEIFGVKRGIFRI